ncbi:MAG TPA: STAS/SEC14 domain-containing protein [Steroidobacteraceae bacterium]|nr:STAS/SEC14 domain-containing protein [Steroidobacteraceae bacterium]
MSLTIADLGPAALQLTVQGKLRKEDYHEFGRIAEQKMATQGKIGLLVHIGDMDGWTPAALWEDIKFDVKHYRDVSRFAIVGQDWSKNWLATLSEPFTAAQVRYFIDRDIESAQDWVRGAVEDGAAATAGRAGARP